MGSHMRGGIGVSIRCLILQGKSFGNAGMLGGTKDLLEGNGAFGW